MLQVLAPCENDNTRMKVLDQRETSNCGMGRDVRTIVRPSRFSAKTHTKRKTKKEMFLRFMKNI